MYLGETSKLSQKVMQGIFEMTLTPLLFFIGIWIFLSLSRRFLPKEYTIWMAILGAFAFLVLPIAHPRGLFSLESILYSFQCVICGVCGIALSYYAYRMENRRDFSGDLGLRFGLVVIIGLIHFIPTSMRIVGLFG